MSSILHLPQYNLQIISFDKVYSEKFIKNFFNNCEEYRIKEITLKNKDVKKLMYHNTIYAICEEIIQTKVKEKSIIFFSTSTLAKTDLNNYINEEELLIFFELLLRKLSKILPVKVFITSNTFSYFTHIWKKYDAKGVELLNNIKAFAEKIDYSKFTFKRIRLFSHRYGLTFLSSVYFNALKSKQLLLK